MRFTPIFQFSIIPVFRSLVMLIDSHAHLEMPEFKKDLEAVIQRAKESGVGYICLGLLRSLSVLNIQLSTFREQFGLAKELDLPIVVHDRAAHRETLEA